VAQKKITDLQLRSSVVGDLNFPSDDTLQSYRVTAAQVFDYVRSRIPAEYSELSNIVILPSVAGSALTIALKNKAGNNGSSTDPIRVGFRNVTVTSGTYTLREITAALSIVISSGSTLGQVSAQPSYIWVYLIDNAGTPELAVSHALYAEDAVVSTTAEGGAGAADSATAIYSTTARTNVPLRCIGYILNTQATAGTWASAGTKVQSLPVFSSTKPTHQIFTSGSGTYITPAGCTQIKVRLVGGGGGGQGSGTAVPAAGDGGTTSFGPMSGTGGAGGASAASAGGTGSGGDFQITGGRAGAADGTASYMGAAGGGTPFGTGSFGGPIASAPVAASANTGGGGGGAGSSGGQTGSGGGGGGYCEGIISNPAASYSWGVGAGGVAGAAGGGGGASVGATGGSGIIIVEEYYD
jgi:hypothetical protein